MPRWYDTQYNLHATDNLEYPFTFNSTSVPKKENEANGLVLDEMARTRCRKSFVTREMTVQSLHLHHDKPI
jgi:hypothetical protein